LCTIIIELTQVRYGRSPLLRFPGSFIIFALKNSRQAAAIDHAAPMAATIRRPKQIAEYALIHRSPVWGRHRAQIICYVGRALVFGSRAMQAGVSGAEDGPVARCGPCQRRLPISVIVQ
jgi:hypothetical protein